jgi:DNA-binding NarL/FixJ family response regulator
MAVQRVFIMWTHPLFHESMRLILNHPHIEWVGSNSDYAIGREQVLSLRPDIVLVEDEDEEDTPTLALGILETCHWDVRVIGLSLSNNKLSMYQREIRIVGQADDLLHLIQGN